MPNKNYLRGRAYEYKAMRQLEEEGYTALRTAGSHGFADVLGFKEGVKVRCIQIKRTKSLPGLKKRLSSFSPIHNGHDEHAFIHELWVWYDGRWYFA